MIAAFDASDTYIWFSEKTSAMCSLSHSSSFLAEYPNSSTSDCAIWSADDRSSMHHAVDPTVCRGGPGRIAMMSRRLETCNACRNAKIGTMCRGCQDMASIFEPGRKEGSKSGGKLGC
jgi:hypothetical protein